MSSSESEIDSDFEGIFGNVDETPFQKFTEAVGVFNMDNHADNHAVPEFLVGLVGIIEHKSNYSDTELKNMFWTFADFHMPVHLLRVVLQKLEIPPEYIPVSCYANYPATCVALVWENMSDSFLVGHEKETYAADAEAYLSDLFKMFDLELPYYDFADEDEDEDEDGDCATIREFIEKADNGMELFELD
jgi:hypothetical protein